MTFKYSLETASRSTVHLKLECLHSKFYQFHQMGWSLERKVQPNYLNGSNLNIDREFTMHRLRSGCASKCLRFIKHRGGNAIDDDDRDFASQIVVVLILVD